MTQQDQFRLSPRVVRSLTAASTIPRRMKRPEGWRSAVEDEWPLELTKPLPWSCEPPVLWPTKPVGRNSPKI